VNKWAELARRRFAKSPLQQRVEALEAEIQECRQANLRLAELTDVVVELLLPVAQQDTAKIDDVLKRYRESVGGPKL